MIKIKPGVEFAVVAPAGFMILQALKRASKRLGVDLTITSGTDGEHSGPTDPHVFGRAFDVRSKDFTETVKTTVLRAIMSELRGGREDALFETSGGLATKAFFGMLENVARDDEHYHLQLRRTVMFNVTDFLAFEESIPGVGYSTMEQAVARP